MDRDYGRSRRDDDRDDSYRDRRDDRRRDDDDRDRGRGREDDRDRGRGREDDRDRQVRSVPDSGRRSRDDDDRGAKRDKDDRNRFLIKLENVRLSYPSLFKPRGFNEGSGDDDGQKAHSANFLFPKDTDKGQQLYDRIQDVIDDAMREKWGKDLPRLKDDKFPIHDGDEKEQQTDGYDGHWYLSARNQGRPKVMDADGKTPIYETDGKIFAGDWVHAWVRIWIMDHKKFGKRVCASLEAVQFLKQGERFGAAPISDDVFQDERSEDERRSTRGRRSSRDDDDRRSRRSRDDDGGRAERRGRDDDDGREERRRRRRDDDEDRD